MHGHPTEEDHDVSTTSMSSGDVAAALARLGSATIGESGGLAADRRLRPAWSGAAVAAPGRRVINLEGDGSALYTVQALWTQARERLNVTTVILSNRKYAILELELANVGANPGRTALDLFDLGNPELDWIRLAGAMGVEGARADTLEGLADLLAVSNQREGPFLIELVIP